MLQGGDFTRGNVCSSIYFKTHRECYVDMKHRAPVDDPSTERSLPMRTSRSSTPSLVFCRWPTPDPTRRSPPLLCLPPPFNHPLMLVPITAMDPSSSSPLPSLAGSTTSTSSSARLRMLSPWRWSRRSKPRASKTDPRSTRSPPRSSLLASSERGLL